MAPQSSNPGIHRHIAINRHRTTATATSTAPSATASAPDGSFTNGSNRPVLIFFGAVVAFLAIWYGLHLLTSKLARDDEKKEIQEEGEAKAREKAHAKAVLGKAFEDDDKEYLEYCRQLEERRKSAILRHNLRHLILPSLLSSTPEPSISPKDLEAGLATPSSCASIPDSETQKAPLPRLIQPYLVGPSAKGLGCTEFAIDCAFAWARSRLRDALGVSPFGLTASLSLPMITDESAALAIVLNTSMSSPAGFL
ncbi:hypothetical protein HGRIS_010719 [Hohenbuehelia grisea]|uniref:Uncharacterized protein n=1 Tax=Hohenbuehelia grisea TaxID=104357 RepID=A0ABR3IXM9_9AGAR